VRVDVRIPGGVAAYVIDLRGERHEASPALWQETYVSAVLRAVLYSDDPTFWLDAYRRLDPLTTPETEDRFLQAAEALFPKGACTRACGRAGADGVQAGRSARTPRSRSRRS
jgi:hypothetical protein